MNSRLDHQTRRDAEDPAHAGQLHDVHMKSRSRDAAVTARPSRSAGDLLDLSVTSSIPEVGRVHARQRHNDQIVGDRTPMAKVSGGYLVTASLPETDALADRFASKWVRTRLRNRPMQRLLIADQHFGQRRLSSQILAFQSLPRLTHPAASRARVSTAVGRGDRAAAASVPAHPALPSSRRT